jgi:hypothetical protein
VAKKKSVTVLNTKTSRRFAKSEVVQLDKEEIKSMIVEAIIKRFNMKKVYTSITLKPIQN